MPAPSKLAVAPAARIPPQDEAKGGADYKPPRVASPAMFETIAAWSGEGYLSDDGKALNFEAGARIEVTRELGTGDWWFGILDGKEGWFPSTFVRCVADARANASATPVPVAAQAEACTNRPASSTLSELGFVLTASGRPCERSNGNHRKKADLVFC